jgi:hypothetical protein
MLIADLRQFVSATIQFSNLDARHPLATHGLNVT